MLSNVLTKPLQGRAYCKMRSNFMNCTVDYDDDAERRATHPDLLPKGGWSVDPEEQAGNSEVVKKAVQLMLLIRQGANPPNHHPTKDPTHIPVCSPIFGSKHHKKARAYRYSRALVQSR